MSIEATTREPEVIVGFEDATPLLDAPDQLRARAEGDGVLFFKGLLPTDVVLELRRQMMGVMSDQGWLLKDTPLMDGMVDPEAVQNLDLYCGCGLTREAYLAVYKLELFHALAHHPHIMQVFEELYGEPVLPHPRNIARCMIPNPSARPTPIHQDFIHVQGTRAAWTVWIPIGAVPRELGGLSVLKGSHKLGVLGVTAAQGAGGLESILCNVNLPWVEHDYLPGDVLTFNSLTVHKSLPNQLGDRIRLSVDYRYQPAADDIEEKSLQVHCQMAGWDEIYEGWTNPDLQYYWTKKDLRLSPWDDSIRWQKERICD
jgi:hypothetical protein